MWPSPLLSLTNKLPQEFRAYAKSGYPYLKIPDDISREPFARQGHIHRFQGSGRGHTFFGSTIHSVILVPQNMREPHPTSWSPRHWKWATCSPFRAAPVLGICVQGFILGPVSMRLQVQVAGGTFLPPLTAWGLNTTTQESPNRKIEKLDFLGGIFTSRRWGEAGVGGPSGAHSGVSLKLGVTQVGEGKGQVPPHEGVMDSQGEAQYLVSMVTPGETVHPGTDISHDYVAVSCHCHHRPGVLSSG